MSEKLSTNEAPPVISAEDEIKEIVAKKQREAYLESLVGDGLNQKRNEEAIEYSTYMEAMSKRDNNYDPYDYDRINKIRDEKDSIINEAQEQENRSIIEHDPKLRRLQMMALDIADFKSEKNEKNSNALTEKQEKFQEVFDKYESGYDINSPEYKILEKIIYTAYPEKVEMAAQDAKESDNSSEIKESVEADEEAEDDDVEQDDEPESEKISEKDAESLPEQEKTIVKAAIDRARDLYYKVGSLYGSAINKTSEFFMPKQGELESPGEYGDRLKRESYFKAIGLTALVSISLYFGNEIIQNLIDGHSGGIDNSEKSSTVATVFNGEALNVESGEGWYQTFKDMGIPKDEWEELLQKVGPQLESSGYAYQMGDSYGISSPGELPKKVLELIQNSR